MTTATTKPPNKPTIQQFIHSGMNWHQFKLLQESFADSPGIRLAYYFGEVEILTVSQDHEIFGELIGILLTEYFVAHEIEFTPTGSFTQEKEGVVSAQADKSYFVTSVGSTPDLSVEVVFTSGNERKLPRYQALGVPEVWFWEDGLFSLYCLRERGYERVSKSELLSDLDIDLLTRCVLMTSKLEAVREFRRTLGG